mmetsp:Transcript_111333/g.311082  ORF Transcript_111333/g.311082 Transcript_111333/m.311082 type:complete len:285 (-) Transcript_111333:1313-2167(-)
MPGKALIGRGNGPRCGCKASHHERTPPRVPSSTPLGPQASDDAFLSRHTCHVAPFEPALRRQAPSQLRVLHKGPRHASLLFVAHGAASVGVVHVVGMDSPSVRRLQPVFHIRQDLRARGSVSAGDLALGMRRGPWERALLHYPGDLHHAHLRQRVQQLLVRLLQRGLHEPGGVIFRDDRGQPGDHALLLDLADDLPALQPALPACPGVLHPRPRVTLRLLLAQMAALVRAGDVIDAVAPRALHDEVHAALDGAAGLQLLATTAQLHAHCGWATLADHALASRVR